MNDGWLVRSHGGCRSRRFHPLHRGTPVDIERLEGSRVTVGYSIRGEKKVTLDKWTDSPCDHFQPKEKWTGWTFLKLRETVGSQGATSGGQNPTSRSASSYEDPRSTGAEALDLSLGISSASISGVVEENHHGRDQEILGYKKSSVTEKGKFVTEQLPKPDVDPKDCAEEEDSWEKVSDTPSW